MGMRIQDGDSVIVDDDRERVGIVVRREGPTFLKIQFRGEGREAVERNRVEAVAQKIAEAVERGSKYSNTFSFKNRSNLGDLAARFGYSADQRLRGVTLTKIKNQLARAGLELLSDGDSADSYFRLQPLADIPTGPDPAFQAPEAPDAGFSLPTPFWPEALGLAQGEQLQFLRALPEPEPLLCLLYMPEPKTAWLQATWEGLLGWAYVSAQRFVRRMEQDGERSSIVRVPPAVLDRYAKGSGLPSENPLCDGPRHANLVTLENGADEREFTRLKAVWPGPVFEFRPNLGGSSGQEAVRSLTELFYAVGGSAGRLQKADVNKMSPLNLLVWARNAAPKLLAAAAIDFGELVSSGKMEKFRGSNESSTALALKALAATSKWPGLRNGAISFEDKKDTEVTDDLKVAAAKRVDLAIKGIGVFEIETLHGSGPIEDFYHRKVFSRLGLASGVGQFHLVVPSDAIIWAGPYLADIAHLLGDRGHVLVPAANESKDGDTELTLVRIKAARLERESVTMEDPRVALSGPTHRDDEEKRITLNDIAGYDEIRALIANEVIWTRKHALVSQAASRAAGILFYGPPGCGKSRIARAICGELGHEVHLRGPADFKGLYLGWGQHLVREEFAWLFEDDKRVLLIDEFDAIARSRREGEMHADEKADVNELLVQLDRASRLGRLVLCTTNFVSSLDEAVVRSGRFSHFVPVGPPDVTAAQAIVSYYLNALGRDVSGAKIARLDIHLPGEAIVLDVVAEACRAQVRSKPYLAGADFEQAVARAFHGAARDVTKSSAGGNMEQLCVEITGDHLRKTLHEVRRSIAWESIEAFLAEIRAHSPSEAEMVESRLLGSPASGA